MVLRRETCNDRCSGFCEEDGNGCGEHVLEEEGGKMG